MTHRDGDVDDLIAALREDLPGVEDDRRVRAQLAAAGLTLGGSASAAASGASGSGAAAAAGGSAANAAVQGSGWGAVAAKLAGLGSGTKALVLVGVVAAGAAYPVGSSLMAPAPVKAHATLGEGSLDEPALTAARKTPPAGAVAAPPATRASARPGGPSIAQRAATTAAQNRQPVAAPPATAQAAPRVGSQAAANADSTADISSLEVETALMERALSALRQGDAASARHWLAEHERRFPNGALVLERRRALEKLH